MEQQQQVNIAVKKIKEIEFFVAEEVAITTTDLFKFGFELTTNFNLSESTVELILSAIFIEENNGNVFMKIKTSNLFLFSELAFFYNKEKNEFNIPDNVLVTFLSLSISHTRALLAKSAIGTKFADFYIPIVNPTEVLKQLFGKK